MFGAGPGFERLIEITGGNMDGRPRSMGDLVVGDVVASSDGSRVWTVTHVGPGWCGRLRVVVTSDGETFDHDRYDPDEPAPAPGDLRAEA